MCLRGFRYHEVAGHTVDDAVIVGSRKRADQGRILVDGVGKIFYESPSAEMK